MGSPVTKFERRKEDKQQEMSSISNRFAEMEQWFQEMFPRMSHPTRWDWPSLNQLPRPFEGKMPHIDIIDRENEVLVKAELPGVNKENLEISTTSNTVTIKGTSRHEYKEEKGDYYRSEMTRGVFARTVTLPAEVASDSAQAKFKDGLLELTLTKLPPKEGHKIQVE